MTARRALLIALAAIACAPPPRSASPAPRAPAPAPGEVAATEAPAPRERATTAGAPAAAAPTSTGPPPRVVLVTVDGIRWQDVFESSPRAWPKTWAAVERRGIALGHGQGCGAVRPRNMSHISLPGYLEIFTGHRTHCMSNVCPQVDEPTVLDFAAAAGLPTASISSWDMMVNAATRHRVPVLPKPFPADVPFVAAGTRWPAPRPVDDAALESAVKAGEKAPPYPATGGPYRPDRFTGPIALAYLRARRPRLLHVGLGDTDEHAHRGDRVGYDVALRATDRFLGDLVATLDSLGLFESTAVLVVSDHGRADNPFREHGASWPESGRSFLFAFGGLIPARGEACARRDLWLTDVSATVRALLGLPRDTTPAAAGAPIEDIVGS